MGGKFYVFMDFIDNVIGLFKGRKNGIIFKYNSIKRFIKICNYMKLIFRRKKENEGILMEKIKKMFGCILDGN